jgi:hypothetical protein
MEVCIFGLRHASDPRPYCPANPGRGCTYGLGHEYPAPAGVVAAEVVTKSKARDKKLCITCGLHPANPAAATNGCAHTY